MPANRASWLRSWSENFGPGIAPSTVGPSLVSAVLRSVPARTFEDPRRSLAAWPATVGPLNPRSDVPSLAPRSMGGQLSDGGAPRRRTAELLAALSGGLDAAEHRPLGSSIRTAIVAVHIADALGRSEQIRAALLYAGLLRDAGTTGRSAATHSGKRSGKPVPQPAHLSRPDRAAAVIRTLSLPATVAEAVCAVDERWDGRGPLRMRRDRIPAEARMLAVASAAAQAISHSVAATPPNSRSDVASAAMHAAENALRTERGKQLDPVMVDICLKQTPATFWKRLAETDPTDQLLQAEPAGDIRRSTPEHVDTVCATFADLVDTRTPMMGRHGVHVAQLAEQVAAKLGFDTVECRELRRAGLLHDIGKLLVPIEYLEKAAELTPDERRVIQDHPRVGAEILRRSRVLAGMAPLIEGHHEPLNGEGHFPELRQPRMALAARILAVCDRFEAMTSERPYRPLLSRDQVWRLLEEAVTEPMARRAFLALRSVVEPD